MRTAVFAVIAASYAATVDAAHLQSFPSYDLAEIEQMEFAQTYDEAGFLDMMSHLAQSGTSLAVPTDVYSLGLSTSQTKTLNELLTTVQLYGQMQANNEDFLGFFEDLGKGIADVTVAAGQGIAKGTIAVGEGIAKGTVAAGEGIAKGTMIAVDGVVDAAVAVGDFTVDIAKVIGEEAMKIIKSPLDLSVIVVGAVMDLGHAALDAVIKQAIKAGDLITQGFVSIIKDLSEAAAELNEIMKDPSKLTPDLMLKFLKKMPVVGDLVKAVDSGAKIAKRAIYGEKETCYRTGLELRSFRFNVNDCPAPGTMVKGSCFMPCNSGKVSSSLLCINPCPAKFPVECGMMCTATDALCKGNDVISKTTELVNAGVTVAKTAGDIASLNVVGFFSKGLNLIEEFAHPLC